MFQYPPLVTVPRCPFQSEVRPNTIFRRHPTPQAAPLKERPTGFQSYSIPE